MQFNVLCRDFSLYNNMRGGLHLFDNSNYLCGCSFYSCANKKSLACSRMCGRSKKIYLTPGENLFEPVVR